jgi:hypothetical protein
MSETTKEIATVEPTTVEGLAAELVSLNKGSVPVFSTITGTDFASRVAVVNAMTNASPLADQIGKPFKLKDVVIQSITMPNERTGEIQAVPRITLITQEGHAFHAISDVVYTDLKNIFAIIGHPSTWPDALPVVAEKVKGKVGSFFTLRISA